MASFAHPQRAIAPHKNATRARPRAWVWLLAISLCAIGLASCGKPRKSVFPPVLSIQRLVVQANGNWRLDLRIQNNSYGEMDFSLLDGSLQVEQLTPIRLHATFERDIPALAADVVSVDVLPTPAMSKALQAIASQGSAGLLPYAVAGQTLAKPEQEDQPRSFEFSGNGALSPVPGIANTFR